MKYVFITFTEKLPPEEAKSVLAELRKKFLGYRFVFTPYTPPGRKQIYTINNQTIILTFPFTSGNQGFTLGDVLKTKRKD